MIEQKYEVTILMTFPDRYYSLYIFYGILIVVREKKHFENNTLPNLSIFRKIYQVNFQILRAYHPYF